MRELVVSYFRFVAFSVAALGLAACARMSLPDPTRLAAEPRLGEPPHAGATVETPTLADVERIRKLETQAAGLGADVVDLRRALDTAESLKVRNAGYVETTMAPASDSPRSQTARLARLYAPAPDLEEGSSLFHQAELGSLQSRQAAQAHWGRLEGNGRLAGLNPRYSTMGDQTRLTVGPLASAAPVDALCVEVSALAGPCRGVAPLRAY